MTERRVTRNAWSRNKSNLALKRNFDSDFDSDDEEIEIDLSEQAEEKCEPKPKKPRIEKNNLFVKYFPSEEPALESDGNTPGEEVATILAEPEVDENDEQSQKENEESVSQTEDKEIIDESKLDLSSFGHFLATPIGTCDPKSIWMSKQGKLANVKKFVNNPAKKRLEELERMVKMNKAKEKRRKLEERNKQPGDNSSSVEVGSVERQTRKGAFRSKVDLTKYYRKDFSTYDEVMTHIKQVEEEHGVRWNKVGNSADFKLSLEEYVEKYGDKIEQRQRLVYCANTAFPIEYFGNPYMVIEESIHLCEFGMGRKYKYETKKKYVDENGQLLPPRTKKICCSAEICVRKIMAFRKISIPENSEYQRNLASKKVREILKGWAARGKKVDVLKKTLGAELLYICWSPTEEAHDMAHPMKDQRVKPVHPAVIAYIRQMTENGVTVGSQMMKCVDHFVRQTFPEAILPEHFGKRPYWPEIKKVRNIMESWMIKKKITRTPRPRPTPRNEVPKRPYRRRIPLDPTKIAKRKKKNGAMSVTGDVWLDEYGELCYTIEEYQANEVVVTTEDGEGEVQELVADVVTDEFEEYYDEDGEVIREEYVYTDDLPMEEIEYTEEQDEKPDEIQFEESQYTGEYTATGNGEYSVTENNDYNVTENGDYAVAENAGYTVTENGDYSVAENCRYAVTENNEYTVAENGGYSISNNGEYTITENCEITESVLEDAQVSENALEPVREPRLYEQRILEAQGTLRGLLEKLMRLSYSVRDGTAIEFAQRYVTDAIELLEENADTDLDSESDMEGSVPEVGAQKDISEQEVVWVAVSNGSNEVQKVEPPSLRTEQKVSFLKRNQSAPVQLDQMRVGEGYKSCEEAEVEAPRTLKVISLPPPSRRLQQAT